MKCGFYTYIWLREDGTPYYVGKGSGRRAFTDAGHCVHKPLESNRILIQEFPDEESAFAAEKFLIDFYGRIDLGTGCLRNLSDGGEGPSGIIVSQEARRNMSLAQRGKKRSPNHLAALRSGFKDMSEESRHRMVTGYLKVDFSNRSEEHCRNISQALKGKPLSEETKKKLSAIRAGRPQPKHQTEAIRKSFLARTTPEQRSAMAKIANQIRWGNKPKT